MRKNLTLLNSAAGVLNKLVSLVFVFFVRYFFARNLDIELMGLEGLFSNILSVFSLVDAGIGSAIAFGLYKPLYENDRDTVSSIMALYKKVYSVIGIIVLALSVVVSPFVPFIIKETTLASKSIITFFLIYAAGVAVSYFFAYKRTLIFATQRNYIVLVIDTLTKVLVSVLQIAVLLVAKSYLGYLILVVVFNFLSNVLVSIVAKRKDLYDEKSKKKLPKEYTKKLITDVKALAITNISWIGINSTDNILISALSGVLDLAKNANYSTIILNISGFIKMFLGGVSASVGDMIAEGNIEKIRKYFSRYTFIYHLISGYVALGVFLVSKSFIEIWVGESFVFDTLTTLIISISLFCTLIFAPVADFQSFSGLFIYYKKHSVIALFINLATSVVLGNYCGIKGVFLGTIITHVYMLICVTHNVHKRLLKIRAKEYLLSLIKSITCVLVTGVSAFAIINATKFHGLLEMILGVMVLTIIYILTNSVMFFKDESYRFFIDFALKQLKKFLVRRK